MAEIDYRKSKSGLDNCFVINFRLREYIPNHFFEINENGDGAELYFYISLLHKFGMFDCKKEHYNLDIFYSYYDCYYNGIPFSMVYDGDYDMVSFCVSAEYVIYREQIAQRIKYLVENEGVYVELLKGE